MNIKIPVKFHFKMDGFLSHHLTKSQGELLLSLGIRCYLHFNLLIANSLMVPIPTYIR